MDVSVFGTGDVGLVQAAALTDVGHHALRVDIDPNKFRQLQQVAAAGLRCSGIGLRHIVPEAVRP
jgi:UDP-glucose 6-dehydrogenase